MIVEVGEDVDGWHVGDRVTASGNIYRGECDMCKQGRVNLCENLAFNGIGRDGHSPNTFLCLPISSTKCRMRSAGTGGFGGTPGLRMARNQSGW